MLSPTYSSTDKTNSFSDFEQLRKILKSNKDKINILKAIIFANPFPVAVWNKNGYLMLANKSCVELFGGCLPPDDYTFWDNPVYSKYPDFQKIKEGGIVKILATHDKSQNTRTNTPHNKRYIETAVCPITDRNNTIECYVFMYMDITQQMRIKYENEQLRNELDEINITRKNLVLILEEEKQKMQTDICAKLRNKVLPLLQELNSNNNPDRKNIELFEKKMLDILKKPNPRPALINHNLTPMEIKICELVKNNLSGKEIAAKLNVAYSTAHSHIQNIRKKLRLTGTGKNLQTFLMETI